MLAALTLILVAVAGDPAATQQRVDELVVRCKAQGEIRLVAQSAHQVAMETQMPPGEVTAAQEQHLACVLNGIKSMPDLNLGFIGNEKQSNLR